MFIRSPRTKAATFQRQLAWIAVSFFMILCAGNLLSGQAGAVYILTGAEDSAIVMDGRAKLKNTSSPLLDLSQGYATTNITLTEGQTVSIRHLDEITTTVSKKGETVKGLLKRLKISPNPLEMVAVDVSGTGTVITIDSTITYYDHVVTVDEAYQTIRQDCPDLPVGTERIKQVGQDATHTAIYEVVWSEGKQVSRQFVEELSTPVVHEIIEVGTAVNYVTRDDALLEVVTEEDGSGVLHFASGTTLKFTQAKSMTATAYTAGHDGADYITATGTHVKVGVAAVDKRVIPLGTRMYIITNDGIVYGVARAEDTGVRGDVIDLYHDTYNQCINFGRRPCTVYILEE